MSSVCSCYYLASPNKDKESLSAHSLDYARQGPLPGQAALCRQRNITPDPGFENHESFMKAAWSLGKGWITWISSSVTITNQPAKFRASQDFLNILLDWKVRGNLVLGNLSLCTS